MQCGCSYRAGAVPGACSGRDGCEAALRSRKSDLRGSRLDITKFAGLPAHPLLVHIPVVLLPLVALGAVAMALSARVCDRLGWTILGLAIVAGLSTQLAVGSGQALRDHVPRSSALDRHVSIADSIRPLALLLFLVALAVMLLDRRARGAWPLPRRSPAALPSWAHLGLIVATIALAALTTVRLYQIGHSGAKATWDRIHLTDPKRPG